VAHLHRERLAHYARTGEAAVLNGRHPLEMPALTSSGAEIRVELTLAPLQLASASAPAENRTRDILLIFRDASLAKRVELQALDAARAETAQAEMGAKLQMSQELLHDSTRELDAALARAALAAARLARLAEDDATFRPQRLVLMARVVELRTQRVRRMLQEIADMAAIRSASFQLDSKRVNLVPRLSRVVAEARSRSAVHQIRLAAPQGLTAMVDAQRIERIAQDLIEQAIRRNPRGCWIDVDLRRPLAGIARLEVRDYGRRLSARERDRLADRVRPDRGWSVIKHIIEQHHGSISIGLPAEGGLRVTLTLPTNRTSGRV
jgi:K+-sensing histidine kinase KdpD